MSQGHKPSLSEFANEFAKAVVPACSIRIADRSPMDRPGPRRDCGQSPATQAAESLPRDSLCHCGRSDRTPQRGYSAFTTMLDLLTGYRPTMQITNDNVRDRHDKQMDFPSRPVQKSGAIDGLN